MDTKAYVEELLAEDETLQRIRSTSAEAGLPTISIAPMYGRFLGMLVAISGAREVLEIGTLGGYSALCLARGLAEGGRVVSLEIDERHARVAEQNLREAGVAERVDVRVGEALASLRAMEAAGERFHLVFIDADKENYPQYLEAALRLAHPGALIAADNVLLRGGVLDPADGTERARAMRQFNRTLMSHPRLESVILPAFDGLGLARVRG